MTEDVRKIKVLLIIIVFILCASAYSDKMNANDIRVTIRAEIQKLKPVRVGKKIYFNVVHQCYFQENKD